MLIMICVGSASWAQAPTNVEAVDLGLPSGTKWANMNVGATTPEGYGEHYAWGEITPKDSYSESNYIGPGSSVNILPPSCDAATMNWGVGWSMPTYDQMYELWYNCSVTWTTINGISGRKFVGPNGNFIFLPAAGYEGETPGTIGIYASCTSSSSDFCKCFWFRSDYGPGNPDSKYHAWSIRPVKNTNTSINIVIQNTITYLLDNDSKTATLCIGTSSSGNVVIPSTITSGGVSYSVTSIGQGAFYGNSSLKSISIPSTITSIGTGAFLNCFNLREIWNYSSLSLSTGSSSYGYVAYYARSIHTTNVASVITSVGDFDFYTISGTNYLCRYNGTSSNVTLPTSYNGSSYRIDNYTFQNKSFIKQLTIPTNVTGIGSNAFYNCTNLQEIWNYSSLSLSKGSSSNGYVAYYAKVIHTTNEPSAFVSVGDFDFYTDGGVAHLARYNGTESSITLPTSYNGNAYVIDASAFQNKSFIQYVTIPANVTSIENNTFYGTSLQKVFCLGSTPATLGGSSAIPQGTVYVPAGSKSAYTGTSYWSSRTIYEGCAADNFAFQLVDNAYLMVDGYIGNAGAESTQTIPSSAVTGGTTYNVTKINSSAFANTQVLTNVVMPNSIEAVGTYAFQGCSNLKNITLSKNITTLSDYAFQNCTSLESIAILSGTITIGSYVFDGCKSLEMVTMRDYVTSIGSYCFRGCESLTSITMSKNITNISNYAFQNCKALPAVSLTGVVSIGSYAYDGCTSIQSVTIPANCTSVATTAFNGCTALRSFAVDASNSYYSTIDGVLTNKSGNQIVAYPSAKGNTYAIPASVTSIGEYAFRGSELTSISIPATVSTIYNYAFANCPNLKKVVFEEKSNYISLRNYIFQNDPLESVEVYRTISNYDSGSYTPFYNNTSLKSAVIGGSATSVYASMFYGCSSLNSITMGDVITSIGSSAFYGCASLASIKIPATVTTIGDAFLSGCSALKEINAKMQTPPVLQSTAFASVDKDACKLIVPAAYVDIYDDTPGWMAFNNIVAEDDATLRKMIVSLTDGGTVIIDSRTYTCEGSHSFYTSATTDVDVVITPSAGFYLKSVKQNGVNVIGQMNGNTLTLAKTNALTTLDITFASSTEITDISSLTYAVYPTQVTGVSGNTLALPINLKNANLIATWQADLVLPEGFTIATDEYGDPLIVVSGSRTTAARHSIATSTVSGGATRILYNSSSNKTISGTDGEVATVTLNIDEDVEPGDYPIIFKNIVMSEANETGHVVERVVSKITIQSYTPGDVNNDGDINAQDLVAVVNYILENPTPGNIREAADLNNDGNVDAMDYVAEVNLILSDDTSSSRAMSKAGVVSDDTYAGMLSVESFALALGEEIEILVSLIDANASYTCCQFDVTLPEGICINDAESTMGSHSVAFRALGNGITRVFVSSPANKVMRNDDIAKLFVKADDMMMVGGYTMDIDNVLLVTPDAVAVSPAPAQIPFSVDGATGVATVETDSIENNRYNVTGQPVNTEAKGIVIVNGKMQFVK